MGRALAFVARDFRIESSYRVAFALQVLYLLASVLMFYYLGTLIDPAASAHLEPYGGAYFPFVLIGIAFNGYLSVGLSGFASRIREAQTTGTLEAMLMTPTGALRVALYSGLWSYLYTTVQVVLYGVLGVVLFGVDLSGAAWLTALLAMALTILGFGGLGLIAAGFIMVLKRGNPVTWAFNAVAGLLGGVFFPVTVLPEWLQALAALLPITYALRAMRLALLQGQGLAQLWPDLLILAGFAVVLVPLGLALFRFAVRRAMVEGTLTHY